LVSSGGSAAPVPASSIPAPPPKQEIPEWLKVAGVAAGAFLLFSAIADALSGGGRSSPRLSPRLQLPPPDPEAKAILRSARSHVKAGAEVYADLPGWPKPPVLNGHIPDVYAEYELSIERTHARRQDAAFSAWAEQGEHREYEQILIKGGRGGRG
jgi:hypothetical protein